MEVNHHVQSCLLGGEGFGCDVGDVGELTEFLFGIHPDAETHGVHADFTHQDGAFALLSGGVEETATVGSHLSVPTDVGTAHKGCHIVGRRGAAGLGRGIGVFRRSHRRRNRSLIAAAGCETANGKQRKEKEILFHILIFELSSHKKTIKDKTHGVTKLEASLPYFTSTLSVAGRSPFALARSWAVPA